jgi:hypothetical protein
VAAKVGHELQLDFQLVEDVSSVCRLCCSRVRDKPLVQVDVFKCFEGTPVPQMVCTSFYCHACFSFFYSHRKTMPFRPPSLLTLVYGTPTSVKSPLVSDPNLFNLLATCCPAEALRQYKATLKER